MADPVEEFEEYKQELLDALGHHDPIEVMREGLRDLKGIVAGASVEVLTRSPAPGEWSAHQVLQHLADTELVYGFRIRMMLTTERPPLVSYDQEAWVNRFSPNEEDPFHTLDRVRVLQEANLKIYDSMTDADMGRTCIHSDWGEISVRLILAMLGGHSLIHLDQMRRALVPKKTSHSA